MIVDIGSQVGFLIGCRGLHVVFGRRVAKREAGVTHFVSIPALPPQL